MRRYKPFLIYNPAKGWAFYPNHGSRPFTTLTVGRPFSSRKTMRRPTGWFLTAQFAAIMEARERSI